MPRPTPLWLLLALQTAVSAASLVVEIVAGRMLAPHVGMSLYTWTSIIAVVLAGFSAGHWWGGRLAERAAPAALAWTGGALLAAALTTAGAVNLLRLVAGPLLEAVGHPVWGIATITMAVFFLPSFFAGVPAPVLAHVSVMQAPPDQQGRALGSMFAAGAIGAIAGTLLAGFLFISWLGTAATLAVVTVTYVIGGLLMFWLARSRALAVAGMAGLAALALAGVALATPSPCTVESRYFCIRTVDMSADPDSPVHLMVIDHLGHGMSARDVPTVMFTEHAAMLDELARRRAPRADFTSFFIGGGSYSIPRAFTEHGTGPMVVAEIDPAVSALAERDFWFDPDTVTILHEDARRALLTRPDQRYDMIIGDAFTDVVVPVHLVTQEFFELTRDRLTEDGTFLMNVIDYEDRLQALGSIVLTLQEVFPSVEVWTQATQPDPGSRMVFVIAAGNTPSSFDEFSAPMPFRMTFGALGDRFVTRIAEVRGQILTDDYAPIDRLIGRPD